MKSKNPSCKYCGFKGVVKFGTYKGAQRYYCKVCHRKFKSDDTSFHMKLETNIVSSAMSVYYEGLSVKGVRRQLLQKHGHAPSSATVYKWIHKFTPFAADSVKEYSPSVGDIWIADETPLKRGNRDLWLFDVIDIKTRFMLATRLSLSRSAEDIQIIMDEAIKLARKKPKMVLTEKLASFLDIYYGNATEHRLSSPYSGDDSASLVRRFHDTLKDRTKVIRGLKHFETASDYAQGWMVNYNYLKPHESLSYRTPTQVAAIDYPYRNWADIIRRHPGVTL
jgi:putative transposase